MCGCMQQLDTEIHRTCRLSDMHCHMKGHSLITSEKVKRFKGHLKKRKKKSTVAGESERKNKEKKEK